MSRKQGDASMSIAVSHAISQKCAFLYHFSLFIYFCYPKKEVIALSIKFFSAMVCSYVKFSFCQPTNDMVKTIFTFASKPFHLAFVIMRFRQVKEKYRQSSDIWKLLELNIFSTNFSPSTIFLWFWRAWRLKIHWIERRLYCSWYLLRKLLIDRQLGAKCVDLVSFFHLSSYLV